MTAEELLEKACSGYSIAADGSRPMTAWVEFRQALRAALSAARAEGREEDQWQGIETAPKDRTILLWAPGREGLPPIQSTCRWHEAAGFCIDELREPTHWRPLPPPPSAIRAIKETGDV